MGTLTEVHVFVPKSRIDWLEEQIAMYERGLQEYAESYWWNMLGNKGNLEDFLKKAIDDYTVPRPDHAEIGVGSLGMP